MGTVIFLFSVFNINDASLDGLLYVDFFVYRVLGGCFQVSPCLSAPRFPASLPGHLGMNHSFWGACPGHRRTLSTVSASTRWVPVALPHRGDQKYVSRGGWKKICLQTFQQPLEARSNLAGDRWPTTYFLLALEYFYLTRWPFS